MKNNRSESKRSKGASPSPPDLGEPSRILFLSNEIEGRLAQVLFDAEARQSEVYWSACAAFLNDGTKSVSASSEQVAAFSAALTNIGIANSAVLSEALHSVTTDDVQSANMIILIQKNNSNDCDQIFGKTFPTFKGEKDVWKIPSDENPLEPLLQNIKSLLIRLILKGGKRAPVPLPATVDKPAAGSSKSQKAVRVRLESKGRGGKKVTVVFGLELNLEEFEKLATELKQSCGTGGTVKDNTIEIQGDQCDRILTELKRRGMQAKRSGG
ncbi:MAG: hypothetical protein SGJ27_22900 [Candidatus Melainabacteria bacterium]|nr:hypothetical protein [Candidatus Melainabacteria bacterium]